MSEDRGGDVARLADIQAGLRRIGLYTKDGREVFLESTQVQDAVVRNLEIIGEAAGKVSLARREEHPEVEWAKMRGFASFAKHEYWQIKADRLWAAVEELSAIERKVARIRADRDSSRGAPRDK